MTAKTYTYTFRDGQKEAYEEHLRKMAGIYGKKAAGNRGKDPVRADVNAGLLRAAEERLSELGTAAGGEVTLGWDGIAALETFACFNAYGAGLFSDRERAYLTWCVRN